LDRKQHNFSFSTSDPDPAGIFPSITADGFQTVPFFILLGFWGSTHRERNPFNHREPSLDKKTSKIKDLVAEDEGKSTDKAAIVVAVGENKASQIQGSILDNKTNNCEEPNHVEHSYDNGDKYMGQWQGGKVHCIIMYGRLCFTSQHFSRATVLAK
jgi:hypothetical protein